MLKQPKPRVLIINDSLEQRNFICKSIEGFCEVIAPDTHDELLERLKEEPHTYAVVIIDYVFEFWSPQQPPYNGGEVLAVLRPNKKDRRPHIILLTNYDKDAKVRELSRDYNAQLARYRETTAPEIKRTVKTLLSWDN